jgi:tetratricopeptide (TPR) repeat protein
MSRRPILLLFAVVAGLLSVLLAIAVNIATGGELPGLLAPYRGLAWPAVAVLAVATVGLAIWQFALDPHPGSHASLLAGGTRLVAQVPLPVVPAELPPDIATFTGRHAELARLGMLLAPPQATPHAALITVVIAGKPGVGKSALAIHLAHQAASRYPDAQLYVDLRGSEPEPLAPEEVLGRFLRALGRRADDIPTGLADQTAAYRSALAGKRALVVLDNAASEAQIRPLLPGSPTCAVLLTSRQALAALDGATPVTLEVLNEDEAVALLGGLASPDRVAAEPAAAATVVRHCGLLPLAVRIAGARLRSRPAWTIATLADQLADERQRLQRLRPGDLDVRTSFALSYAGIDPAAARAFRLLGLLTGPDFAAGVAAALTGTAVEEAEATLEGLADAQLLETPAAGCYRFHDLLRLFARERDDSEEPAAEQHAALERAVGWYRDATHDAAAQLRVPGPATGGPAARQAAWAWLERERPNLVAAVEQAASRHLDVLAADLSFTLADFFDRGGYYADEHRAAEVALVVTRRTGDRRGQAKALHRLGSSYRGRGQFDEAISYHTQHLEVARELDHRGRQAQALMNLGSTYRDQRRFDEAIDYYQQSLTLCREPQGAEQLIAGEGRILSNLGLTYHQQGQLDKAIVCYDQSLAASRRAGDHYGAGTVLMRLGDIYREQQRLEDAAACYQQSLGFFQESSHRHSEGLALLHLGSVTAAIGNEQAARKHWHDALAIFVDSGAPQADEVRALLRSTTDTDS